MKSTRFFWSIPPVTNNFINPWAHKIQISISYPFIIMGVNKSEDYHQLVQDLEILSDNAKIHHHSNKEDHHLGGLKRKERQERLSSKKLLLPPALPSSPGLDDYDLTMQAIRRQKRLATIPEIQLSRWDDLIILEQGEMPVSSAPVCPKRVKSTDTVIWWRWHAGGDDSGWPIQPAAAAQPSSNMKGKPMFLW
jgi:hypothetical protein